MVDDSGRSASNMTSTDHLESQSAWKYLDIEPISQLLPDHISRKPTDSFTGPVSLQRVLTDIQNASTDTHQATRPPRLHLEPNPPHLCTRNRNLRHSSSDHPRTANPADIQSRTASTTIPTYATTLSQAAGGPQNPTPPPIPIAAPILASDPDIPAQQCESGRMDEHKAGASHCPPQAGCRESEERARDACRGG